MTERVLFLALAGSALAHSIITAVIALFARHKVEYLALAWVNGIFFVTTLVASFFSHAIACGEPGILHPGMLLALLCACYLQSIYPLSIPMPGFLQWERMWMYARPILGLLGIYAIAALLGSRIVYIYTAKQLLDNILSSDILMRLCALGLSIYYIANIFMVPRRMARHANVPSYLLGYCISMGLSVVFYTYVAIIYDVRLLSVYVVLFTILNLYLMFRTLETIALQLPRPVINEVAEEPKEVKKEKEREDFNEANLYRFQRINFWMQNHKEEWKESSFGRDMLCQETGLNRHLVLQSVRSQGFNNIHEYINSFRVMELKRMIENDELKNLNDVMSAGFGTTVTARTCFLKSEGITLDAYMALQRKPQEPEPEPETPTEEEAPEPTPEESPEQPS